MKTAGLLQMINDMAAGVKNCQPEHVSFRLQTHNRNGFWSCDVEQARVSHGTGWRVVRRAFFGVGDTPGAAYADALGIARAARDNGEEGF